MNIRITSPLTSPLASPLASVIMALLLAACGGSDHGASDTPGASQQKAQRSSKQSALEYQNAVQSLYVAYFGRPADPGGLANFSAALQAAGAPTDVAGLAQAYAGNASVRQLSPKRQWLTGTLIKLQRNTIPPTWLPHWHWKRNVPDSCSGPKICDNSKRWPTKSSDFKRSPSD